LRRAVAAANHDQIDAVAVTADHIGMPPELSAARSPLKSCLCQGGACGLVNGFCLSRFVIDQ